MPTNVWIRRIGLADSDMLEKTANEHLAEVEAHGGRLVNSFFATAPSMNNKTILILTLITEEPTQHGEGIA